MFVIITERMPLNEGQIRGLVSAKDGEQANASKGSQFQGRQGRFIKPEAVSHQGRPGFETEVSKVSVQLIKTVSCTMVALRKLWVQLLSCSADCA